MTRLILLGESNATMSLLSRTLEVLAVSRSVIRTCAVAISLVTLSIEEFEGAVMVEAARFATSPLGNVVILRNEAPLSP